MKRTLHIVVQIVFLLGAFVVPALVYSRLPDPMPTHWDMQGNVNGTTGKPWGPFVVPLISLVVWGVLRVVPRISPKEFSMESFRGPYETMITAVTAYMAGLSVLVIALALGYPVPLDRVTGISAGGFAIVLGNLLGKTSPNFFMGIRTPWTLANPEVWLRTHRLAGFLLVGSGVLAVLLGIAGVSFVPGLVAMGAALLTPVVYSYVLYRRVSS